MIYKPKSLYGIGLLLVLLLSFASPALDAGTNNNSPDLYLNGGVWKGNVSGSWTAGFNLDLQLGSRPSMQGEPSVYPAFLVNLLNNLIVSPEVMVLGSSSDFGSNVLAPAVILNINAGNIYVGAGLGVGFNIGAGGSSNSFAILLSKVNIVYMVRRFRLTLFSSFIIASHSHNRNTLIGVTIGYKF
jgi:hypothetical protein